MQARAKLLAAMGARGDAYSNLWLAQSFRGAGRLAITSDAAFMHFVLLEFAPQVRTFDLHPTEEQVLVGDQLQPVSFDAVVDFMDGHRECRDLVATNDELDGAALFQRELRLNAARRLGATHVHVRIEDLQKQTHAFWNGVRMLRTMTAAQGYAQTQFRNAIVSRLEHSGELPLGELIGPFARPDQPLAEAAVYHLLSERYVAIDLGHGPITLETSVRWI